MDEERRIFELLIVRHVQLRYKLELTLGAMVEADLMKLKYDTFDNLGSGAFRLFKSIVKSLYEEKKDVGPDSGGWRGRRRCG